MGYKYLIKNGSYINTDFAYKKITYDISPFDFETFSDCDLEFKVGAFNCMKGKTYDLLEALIASGSIPFISKEAVINEKIYLDGNSKNIIILTEDKTYKKDPLKLQLLINLYYKKYPKVAQALNRRHLVYNRSLREIEELEEKDAEENYKKLIKWLYKA